MDAKQRDKMQARMMSTWLTAVKLKGQLEELITKYPALKGYARFMALASEAAGFAEDLEDYEQYVRDASDEDWLQEPEPSESLAR